MSVGRGDRLWSAFDDLMRMPAERRESFAREQYAEDASLLGELLGMIQHADSETSFLDPPASDEMKRLLRPTSGSAATHTRQLPRLEGRIFAGRYETGRRIGSGGAGVVHLAKDRLTGREVALKVLYDAGETKRAELRREAAALRLLQLPGVVQLIDDGVEDGLAWLVTEYVEGVPFPGERAVSSWADLEDVAKAFLETLDRIHWAGIVHGDLKPGNVLVRPSGVPVILDLGIARGPRAAVEASSEGRRGTLRYAAPEQISMGTLTPQSDLYAVGVMLHEALVGDPYRSDPSVALARLGVASRRDAPSAALSDSVPAHVRSAVERMLAPDADARPESAREVLALLEGDAPDRSRRQVFFTGRDRQLEAIRRAVDHGQALTIHGPPGSGRTRLCEEAAAALSRAGYDVVSIRPGDAAPSSLGERTVLLVDDDDDLLSPWLRGEIERAGQAHPIVRFRRVVRRDATGVAEELPPLTEPELRRLFLGADPIFHLREDAARELFRRSRGNARAAVDELDAWSRAGLGWWEGARYRIRRQDLDLLCRGLRAVMPRAIHERDSGRVDERDVDLLLEIELAGPRATPALLAEMTNGSLEDIESRVEDLRARGFVGREEGGHLQVSSLPPGAWARHASIGRWIHERLAQTLPPGDERRLMHWLAAGRIEHVPEEAILVGRRLCEEGDFEGARAAAAEGLNVLDDESPPSVRPELLQLGFWTAMQLGTRAVVQDALYRLETDGRGRRMERAERIARGLLAAIDGQPERALATCPRLELTADEDEARLVAGVRLYAARVLGVGASRAETRRTEAYASALDSEPLRLAVAASRAWLLYQDKHYEEAANLHVDVASTLPLPALRNRSLVNAASAFMEAGNLERAEQLGREALEHAVAGRRPPLEARASWIVRAAAYRRGAALAPRPGLALASEALGLRNLTILLCVNEAAIAWRAGRNATAARLARRAANHCRTSTDRNLGLLARALAFVARPGGRAEASELLAECRASDVDPRIAFQAAALIGRACDEDLREEAAGLARRLIDELGDLPRRPRQEVLSIAEAVK